MGKKIKSRPFHSHIIFTIIVKFYELIEESLGFDNDIVYWLLLTILNSKFFASIIIF